MTSGVRLCPICQTGYITGHELHPSCEGCGASQRRSLLFPDLPDILSRAASRLDISLPPALPPSLQQLTRTPPLRQVKKQLDFCSDNLADGDFHPHVGSQCTAEPQQETEQAGAKVQDGSFFDLKRTFDLSSPKQKQDASPSGFRSERSVCGDFQQPPASSLNGTVDINNSQPKEISRRSRTGSIICSASVSEVADANSMLRGMQGYELTPADREFVEKMQKEKRIKKLQGEVEEVKRLLKTEIMALELALAAKERAEAELRKFPPCEEVIDLAKVFLKTSLPLTEGMEMEPRSLVAKVKEEDVQRAIEEKREELAQMETMLANKRQKEIQEIEQQEKQILSKQRRIQGMMSHLSELKSELDKLEGVSKPVEMEINTFEEAEIKVEVEDTDTKEEPQATESKVHSPKPQRTKRKEDKTAETLQDTTNQSKPTKRNTRAREADRTDNQSSLKDDIGSQNAHEALKTSTKQQTKQKAKDAKQKLTKTAKAAKVPQRKVTEQEAHPPESLQAVRGRNTAKTSKTATSQEKSQSKADDGGKAETTSQQPPARRTRKKADVVTHGAAEEDQNPGLRRSKRIASKRLNVVDH